ncbi:MAG: hypothetical protein WBS24_17060 [Terriglobales bacterium]
MASDRAKLVLDEQSFQGLLAAAFTIQEHNARMNSAEPLGSSALPRRRDAASPQTNEVQPGSAQPPNTTKAEADSRPDHAAQIQSAITCPQCGVPLPAPNASCPNCSMPSFRPGERLQRNWASLWQMSQEQGPDAHRKTESDLPLSPADPGRPRPDPVVSRPAPRSSVETVPLTVPPNGDALRTHETAERPADPPLFAPSMDSSNLGRSQQVPNQLADPNASSRDLSPQEQSSWDALTPETSSLAPLPPEASTSVHQPADWNAPMVTATDNSSSAGPLTIREPWEDMPVADSDPATDAGDDPSTNPAPKVHFRRADLYLAFAIIFAIAVLVWPSAGDQKPKLPPWQRALIAIGIAEAPQPVAHFHGDPELKVWVDTHTALYYCPGDELYGKSPDGHYSTQREAQADRFEPAERSVCIE